MGWARVIVLTFVAGFLYSLLKANGKVNKRDEKAVFCACAEWKRGRQRLDDQQDAHRTLIEELEDAVRCIRAANPWVSVRS